MTTVIIGHAKTYFHNEQILIIIAQNGIPVAHAVQIVVLKLRRQPGHIHIVKVQHIQLIADALVGTVPPVSPCRREHSAVKLGAVLHVIAQRQLRRSSRTPFEVLRQEWSQETREPKFGLHAILFIVLVLISFQPGDGLKGSTKLNGEGLRATKQVTVFVGQRRGSTQVARCVGTFGLEADGATLIGTNLNVAVEQRRVGNFLKLNVRIPHGLHFSKIVIGALQVGGAEGFPLFQPGVFLQHFASQVDDRVLVATQIIHVADEVTRMECFG